MTIIYDLYTADHRVVVGYSATVNGDNKSECYQKAFDLIQPNENEYIYER